MTKIQHKRSSVLVSGAAKAPTSAQLDYGELAINYSSTDPQLFIKDSSGSVISILSSYAPLDGATFTGDVNFDAEAIIKGDSTNSGALTLNSETNSKYVKIQAPANSSLTSYTLTLPNDDGGSGEVLSTDGSGGLSWAYAAMSTADKTKLDGIAAGAEVNVNADWTASSGDAEILNKPTNISTFTNDVGYITSPDGGNAGTLDGIDSSQFLRSDTSDTFTGTLSIIGSINNSSTGGSSGAILGNLEVGYGAAYNSISARSNSALHLNYNSTGTVYVGSSNTVWHAGNDGSGSGLDADLLDGIQASSFLRSDAGDAASQRISFTANATNNWDTIATSSGSQGSIEVYNSGAGNDAFMAFHTGSDYAIYFGLDADTNDLSVGGWSMGANKYRVWHAGNDGAGSGLDADNLDGLTWTSSGKNLRGTEIYADSWFRNYDSGEGLYNEANAMYWYSDANNTFRIRSNQTSVTIRFATASNTTRGFLYADTAPSIGFLNTGGQWGLRYLSVDGNSPNLYFQEEGNESWTGNPGNDTGKIEYHSNRFYIASGANSTELCRFRRSGSDVAYINNSGNFYSPIMYDNNNTGYYIDPASHSNLNTARFQGNACYIRGSSPTLYFQDTNENSAMLHNNSNLLYVLRGGTDSTTWSQVSSQWPFIFYLSNNNAKCGGSFEAVGNITAYSSDRRLKQNFKPIESALDKVNELNGLYFDWKTEVIDLGFTPDQMTDDIGLIAQDVQAVLPQAVKPAPFDQTWDNDLNKNVSTSGEDYITVQYERLVPLLVEAIKELSVRLTSLENKL